MIRGCWALIPVKTASEAKARLSGLLNPQQRAALQRAMLEDMLDGLRSSTLLSGVACYGPDAPDAAFIEEHGVHFLEQPRAIGGLNDSVSDGAMRLAAMGADIIAVLPGDLPLARGEDLDRGLSDVAQSGDCLVVPDRWHEGTNAVIFPARRPPTFRFGRDSFRAHLTQAAGPVACHPRGLCLQSFAIDVDTPADLAFVGENLGPDQGHRIKAFLRDAKSQRGTSQTSKETWT